MSRKSSICQIARDIMNSLIRRTIPEPKLPFEEELLPPRRVTIQKLNGNGEIDPASLLPVQITSEHLIIEDVQVINDEHENNLLFEFDQSLIAEDYEVQWDERVIYWLPQDVCLVNSFDFYLLTRLFNREN